MKSMYARNRSTELPDFISADGDILITDSLRVAQVHKKRHDNVMQLIRKRVAEAGSWGLLNFKEATILTRKQPAVRNVHYDQEAISSWSEE
jgi:Rha family phage regulatory protein